MKRLLSILGTVSLIATGSSNIISCNTKETPKCKIINNILKLQDDINIMVGYEIDVNKNTTINDIKKVVTLDNTHGLFDALKKHIKNQYVVKENMIVGNVYSSLDNDVILQDIDVNTSKNVFVEIKGQKNLNYILFRVKVELITL